MMGLSTNLLFHACMRIILLFILSLLSAGFLRGSIAMALGLELDLDLDLDLELLDFDGNEYPQSS